MSKRTETINNYIALGVILAALVGGIVLSNHLDTVSWASDPHPMEGK